MKGNEQKSEDAFELAKDVLVGGVNSPVRAFKSVGGNPIFMQAAAGSVLTTVDSKELIDYVGSWGPMILGHAHPKVVQAIQEMASKAISFGAPTTYETQMGLLVKHFFPSMQQLRFVNSGTEATMSAIRLARGVTKRDIIVKFEGCYHGHVDSLLVSSGSGGLSLGQPDSAGVPDALSQLSYVLPYNNVEKVLELFAKHAHRIAAVIVEPIAGNMGLVPASEHFLQTLKSCCAESGALLIFDEVMTGFRVDLGGAQALYGISPDITCLGKVVGGGLPCAVYGGKKEIMQHIAPNGPVYQAGTLAGNPLAMAAGIATLTELKSSDAFQVACSRAKQLENLINDQLDEYQWPCQVIRRGSMLCLFFNQHRSKGQTQCLDDVKKAKSEYFSKFFHELIDEGVYWPPSMFEVAFISASHSLDQIEYTSNRILKILKKLFS